MQIFLFCSLENAAILARVGYIPPRVIDDELQPAPEKKAAGSTAWSKIG